MRYFTGRYMTARDFRDEQNYHLTHRHLHSRILHGWGVACGLYVHPHPQPECQPTHVVVDCGMAIDCCGRDVVVPRAVASPPLTWPDAHTHQTGNAAAQQQNTSVEQQTEPARHGHEQHSEPERRHNDERYDHERREEDRRWYALLCLEYCESEIEVVPVLYSEHTCDKPRSEHSRMRESFKLSWHWVRHRDLSAKYFWKTRGGGVADHHDGRDDDEHEHGGERRHHRWPDDDCDTPGQHGKGCCLDTRCPPHHCVPIAVVSVRRGEPIHREDIHTIGRPSIEPPADSLTHIAAINWPHGGTVSRGELERRLKRLEIRFDRRLKRTEHGPRRCGPVGVNPCTFIVQYGGGAEDEDLDFVPYTEAPHVEHDRVAVYSMEGSRRRHDHSPFAYLEHHTVYIALKCDFILDCHGNPVDGDHLGGILPSGDGIRGGTFESWFSVVPDHEWERHRHHERQQEQV